WVIAAEAGKFVTLDQWPAGAAGAPSTAKTLTSDQLTGTVGGSIAWTGMFDAGLNRFSFFDPLTDVPALVPSGAVDNLATYLVAGWYSDPKLDPLDVADTVASLSVRLAELNWSLMSDAEGGDQVNQSRDVTAAMRSTLGLETAQRYKPAVSIPDVAPAANA